MTPRELELRADELLEQAASGQLGEDSLVELKSEWPEPANFAPQLCGLVNSARGTPVVLLVGVRKDGTICGAAQRETATWDPQLEARFDHVAPRLLTDLRLQRSGAVVHALAFDSALPPYVVKPADPGRAHERRVHIRSGGRTLDAGRLALLRMLVPVRERPTVELLHGVVRSEARADKLQKLSCVLDVFIALPDHGRLILPAHHAKVTYVSSAGRITEAAEISSAPGPGATHVDIDGAARVRVVNEVALNAKGREYLPKSLELTFLPVGQVERVVAAFALTPTKPGTWLVRAE